MNANDIIPYVRECLGNTLQELHDAWKNDKGKYNNMLITCPSYFVIERNMFTDEPKAISIKVSWSNK